MSDPSGKVQIRAVEDGDVEIFFEHQRDPEASQMAAFPPRGRAEFMAHWAKIRTEPTNVLQTVVLDGAVAGNVVSWQAESHREIGYWLGRDHWGRGIATAALTLFVGLVTSRPLYAYVAPHNAGSIRVLEKVGFHLTDAPGPLDPDEAEHVVLVLDA